MAECSITSEYDIEEEMMERLTYRDKDGFQMMKKRGGFKQGGVEHLAAYEDTERTPEEIAAMQHTLDEYHKAADPLLRAQADGRLVVLPCKVGDTLYEVTGRKTISEYRVKAIRVELFCVFIEWEIEKGFVWHSLAGITQNEIGKTVFLTREEAEKELEAMKNE